MHYYPFNISDFSQSTKHLTILEKAIYRELIDLYYDKEAPLINEPEKLARLICASDNLTDVEQVLNEFFTLVDNHWTNERCDKVIADYHSKLETASRAGKASAKSRAAKLKASKEVTTVERPLNDSSTNQELITNNQELRKPVPYIEVVKAYNEHFADVTGNATVNLETLSSKRKKAIKKMWNLNKNKKSDSVDYWITYFTHCATFENMQFGAPRSEKFKNWNPNFDFLMREETLDKARENNL